MISGERGFFLLRGLAERKETKLGTKMDNNIQKIVVLRSNREQIQMISLKLLINLL
jgi:hypothetical protein